MTHAFAIAYDWLYDAWTPEQRQTLRDALLQKGLALGLESYRTQVSYGWWTRAHHNRNQVCNGGIGMGALSIADEAPEQAGEFLRHALESLQLPMADLPLTALGTKGRDAGIAPPPATSSSSPSALDLVWFDAQGEGPQAGGLPLDEYFRGVEVATFRSAWEDRNALFVGFKAGDNKANHSNLDLGSFVLDALGQRWVVDLGADNYNLPGYSGGRRWQYYRMRAEGHNTLVIDPGPEPDQDPKAATRIVRFVSNSQRAFAIADLTPAQVQLNSDGTTATLTLGEARLVARLLSPSGAQFRVRDAQPLPSSPHPEEQATNNPVRKLAVHLNAAEETRLRVLLAPLSPGAVLPSATPAVVGLDQW
jgi:hypothetical protein